MKSKISIRKPKIEELSMVSKITKLAYKSPYKEGGIITGLIESPDFTKKYKNKEFGILIAVSNGKIIGAVRYSLPKKNILYFYKLAVLKSFRGKGTGAKLVGEIERTAKRKGIKNIILDCMKEKHLPEYYKKLGYKTYKTILKKSKSKNHGDYHEVHMYKICNLTKTNPVFS